MTKMREIKFRAKSKYNGSWYVGYIAESEGCADYLCIDGEGVENETIGQYIGLKDKNQREIFEGDIVQYQRYKKKNYEVYFNERDASFGLRYFYDSGYDYPGMAFSEGVGYFEVVGNIHENPELLTKEPQ